MPLCTGAPSVTDIWICPYCSPKEKSDSCYRLIPTDEGVYKVPCSTPCCTRAGYKAHDCGVFWQHLQAVHGWPALPPRNAAFISLEQMPDISALTPSVLSPVAPIREVSRGKKDKKKKHRR